MDQIIFITGMAMMVAGSLWWGFTSLPREKWQIMAVLPRHKTGAGWQGLNLTYYGLLSANAYTFAVILFLILATAARIPLAGVCLFVAGVLAACLPASRIIARIVEKKKGTLTVGGAVFVGILVSPVLVFTGPLKKITYASGYDGQKELPVQIITAALYTGTGLAGTALFLNGYFRFAFLITLAVTQIWRFVSEFLRADFRGDLTISAYQIMSLATLGCAGAMALLLPMDGSLSLPRLHEAVSALWNPWMVLFVQGVWAAAFLHTGKSVVTGSSIIFHVEKTRV